MACFIVSYFGPIIFPEQSTYRINAIVGIYRHFTGKIRGGRACNMMNLSRRLWQSQAAYRSAPSLISPFRRSQVSAQSIACFWQTYFRKRFSSVNTTEHGTDVLLVAHVDNRWEPKMGPELLLHTALQCIVSICLPRPTFS